VLESTAQKMYSETTSVGASHVEKYFSKLLASEETFQNELGGTELTPHLLRALKEKSLQCLSDPSANPEIKVVKFEDKVCLISLLLIQGKKPHGSFFEFRTIRLEHLGAMLLSFFLIPFLMESNPWGLLMSVFLP